MRCERHRTRKMMEKIAGIENAIPRNYKLTEQENASRVSRD